MTAKTTSRTAPVRPVLGTPPDIGPTAPWTTEERLVPIQALGKRIDQHIHFILRGGQPSGTSLEGEGQSSGSFLRTLAIPGAAIGPQLDLQLG